MAGVIGGIASGVPVAASSATTAWVSAAVAVLGATASIVGLIRYFAMASRGSDEPAEGPGGEVASEWTPVFRDRPDTGAGSP